MRLLILFWHMIICPSNSFPGMRSCRLLWSVFQDLSVILLSCWTIISFQRISPFWSTYIMCSLGVAEWTAWMLGVSRKWHQCVSARFSSAVLNVLYSLGKLKFVRGNNSSFATGDEAAVPIHFKSPSPAFMCVCKSGWIKIDNFFKKN